MKKLISIFLLICTVFTLSGCALGEWFNDKDNEVDLGDADKAVRWNLVSNDNAYRKVDSAYFDFYSDRFQYFENGELKKEGDLRINYYGVDNVISPLHLNLDFGVDEDGVLVFDYIDCYTEDSKDDLRQFTIMREAYHVEPVRNGGVPVRDYHLSEMPYAFGTYVKESCEKYTYKNGKANYLNCSILDGTFTDGDGNKFYFLNNSYSSAPNQSIYTVYMRYENAENGKSVEGTVYLSYYEDFFTSESHDCALIYTTHGEGEPSEEAGVTVDADFMLIDFELDGHSFSFLNGELYADESECEFAPMNFVGGTYEKRITN